MILSKENNLKMEEIREFIPISKAAEFDSLAPHIRIAEQDFLIPLIGRELYNYMVSMYDGKDGSGSGVTDNSLISELLKLMQSSVIHLAYWIGFDVLNSHVSDGGFKRIESDTVKGLYRYQEDNLKNYLKSCGFNQLDHVLEFLESNIAEFEDYRQSANCSQFRSMIIQTTDQFNRIVFINSSRLTFLRMKAHLSYIEETSIRSTLGELVYLSIKGEIGKDVPSTRVKNILPYIQKPLAFLASALLMEESGADLTDNGLYFASTKVGNVNTGEWLPTNEKRIGILVARNRSIGEAYLDQLRTYLEQNHEIWPEATVTTGKLFRRDNTGKKTFWQ